MKKILLLAPVLLLVGCSDYYATSNMTAIGEKVCIPHGGMEYVEGLSADYLFRTGWESSLVVTCADGTHIETPKVSNIIYRTPKQDLTNKK